MFLAERIETTIQIKYKISRCGLDTFLAAARNYSTTIKNKKWAATTTAHFPFTITYSLQPNYS
jgi:hypothetical protein